MRRPAGIRIRVQGLERKTLIFSKGYSDMEIKKFILIPYLHLSRFILRILPVSPGGEKMLNETQLTAGKGARRA